MREHESSYHRIPLRLIYISFLIAMILDFIPLSGNLFYWLPEFTAMMLFYWLINRPQSVGIGTAFALGLLVDIGTSSPLGQHALAYIATAYLIIRNRRQLVIHNYGLQAIVVAVALLLNELILVGIHLRFDQRFAGWLTFLSPVIGAFLWPMLNKIMVSILNFRYLRR